MGGHVLLTVRPCSAPSAIVHGPRHGAHFSGGGLLSATSGSRGSFGGACALAAVYCSCTIVHDGLSVNVRPSTPNIQISMNAIESWHGGNGGKRCSRIQENVGICVSPSLRSPDARSDEAEELNLVVLRLAAGDTGAEPDASKWWHRTVSSILNVDIIILQHPASRRRNHRS